MIQQLKQKLQTTNLLSQQDREYLLSMVDKLTPLEKLKLLQALNHGQAAEILQILNANKAQFFGSEKKNNVNFLQKAKELFNPEQKANQPLHTSLLTNQKFLGGSVPRAVVVENLPPLGGLSDITDLAQLQLLSPEHVYFNLNQNFEQEINNFLELVDKLFDRLPDLNQKRNYFMNYIQSPLFGSYLNTGLTALKHPELQPARIVLNLLYQINPIYLNNRQFRQAAIITNHLRSICGF